MKKVTFLTSLFLLSLVAVAQQEGIERTVHQHEIKAHLSFLAADEMRGREAGTPEIDIAANYIRTVFSLYNLPPAPGTEDYFQAVTLVNRVPPSEANATVGKSSFTLKNSLIVISGHPMEWAGDMLYVGFGEDSDLQGVDVRGKMIVALAGARDADNFNKIISASFQKIKKFQDAGALGLLEILAVPQAPWPALVNYLSQPRMGVKREGDHIPHAWLKPSDLRSLNFKNGESIKGMLSIKGKLPAEVSGKNVAALVAGTDEKLKDEYIVITAHYDHVGVQNLPNSPDSIHNGARDNAIGTVALTQIGKYLSANPAKRSVILLALTAEEKGLLGSEWYCEHPLVPLRQTVLNINCDGVGYNDKSILTSISWGRTNTDGVVSAAASAFGLGVGGDPDPAENFFERSDQVSFARKGVVAIKLQPGLARMDQEIRKYYHRPADEVSSLDFEYLTKFYRAFVYAAALLANDPARPAWKAGDKFEPVSKELYGE